MRKSNRLVDELLRTLEHAILCGELRPGERMLATHIAAEQEVSLTTVREAFLMLEQRGLVRSKPRRGTFVTRISEREAYELCQARALLESYALALRGAPLDPTVMLKQISVMQTCRLPRDLPRLIDADLAFHRSIIEQGASTQLVELWSSLSGRIGALILRSVEEQSLSIRSVVELHQTLVEPLTTGALSLAQEALVRHYLRERPQPVSDAEMIVHTLSVVLPDPVPPASASE